jgi:hypothetical protein
MTQEQLRMQMLAGIITESQYKEKIQEDNENFKSLDFGKLSTLFQMLIKIPANAGYTDYNMDTGETNSGMEGITSREYATPKFFQKLKDLQNGLQKGDKEAGADFNEFFPSLSNSKKFPFILYNGEKDLFMPTDYETLDDLNKEFNSMSDAVQFTSKYKDNNIDVANPEWNNFVDAANNINLDDFKKYVKK